MVFGKTPLLKSNNFAREIIATLSSQDTPRGGIVCVSQDAINASVSGIFIVVVFHTIPCMSAETNRTESIGTSRSTKPAGSANEN